GPAGPVAPATPWGPWAPVAPVGPAGPCAPVGPGGPTSCAVVWTVLSANFRPVTPAVPVISTLPKLRTPTPVAELPWPRTPGPVPRDWPWIPAPVDAGLLFWVRPKTPSPGLLVAWPRTPALRPVPRTPRVTALGLVLLVEVPKTPMRKVLGKRGSVVETLFPMTPELVPSVPVVEAQTAVPPAPWALAKRATPPVAP